MIAKFQKKKPKLERIDACVFQKFETFMLVSILVKNVKDFHQNSDGELNR